MIYLDYASTTPLNNEVLKTYTTLLQKYFANADSMHDLGHEVEKLHEQARLQIGKLLNVKNTEIIFTSGASEANSLAIKGFALKNKKRGSHIITSCVEHSSVMNSFKQLEDEFGFKVTLLPVNKHGQVELKDLLHALQSDTILVSIMLVNNEIGSINNINELADIVHENSRAVFHVDAVQGLGKVKINLENIDMASFSAHKINGLKGSGFLYKKDNIQLLPLVNGGQQEQGIRGGTSNACTNIVLAKTLRIALEKLEQNEIYIYELNKYIYKQLSDIKEIEMNSGEYCSKYIINFSCLYISSEIMMNSLNNYGIMCSAQSTCSSRTKKSSRVVQAIGKSDNIATNAIRISISDLTTKEDIDAFIKILKEIIYGFKTK